MGNIIDKVLGGALATGLSENIREGYIFIANNYSYGDEIYLIGFSRGAFTARSIAAFIGFMGLLTKDGLPFTAEVFEDWEHRQDPKYSSAHPDIPFPGKPSASDPSYRIELQRVGMRKGYRTLYQNWLISMKRRFSRLDIPIKAVAVWDTVGKFSHLHTISTISSQPYICFSMTVGLTSKSLVHRLHQLQTNPFF